MVVGFKFNFVIKTNGALRSCKHKRCFNKWSNVKKCVLAYGSPSLVQTYYEGNVIAGVLVLFHLMQRKS
jgi:hypothetical protein